MKLFLLILFLLIPSISAKDVKPLYFVDAKGGLYLREEPLEKSKSIILIPDKSEIQFIKEVGGLIEISKKLGSWTEIQFGNKKGFVFGAYIRKYFLFDKKFSPNKKMFYEYYTPEANNEYACFNNEMSDKKACFIKIHQSINRKLIKILNHNEEIDPVQEFGKDIWFGTKDWLDNKSLLIIAWDSDAGNGFRDIGYLNIYSGKYATILESNFGVCVDNEKFSIEKIKFNDITFFRITSENPKLQTGFFTMLKPKADDYDKLLETCKRDTKNSVLIKPITIVRKNYTFKINSKRAFLYFKGKDILKS